MRIVVACIVGILGLGAIGTMAACSDATDAGSGGAGGQATAGASNAGSPGAGMHSGGSSGDGSGECSFLSDACSACFEEKCTMETTDCAGDATCGKALNALIGCACASPNSLTMCQNKFVTDGKDLAMKFAQCYTLNCEDACQ